MGLWVGLGKRVVLVFVNFFILHLNYSCYGF